MQTTDATSASSPRQPSHGPTPEWVTPLIDALAHHMWDQTHDGSWNDPYCTEDQTRLIYWGDAEAALKFLNIAPDTKLNLVRGAS